MEVVAKSFNLEVGGLMELISSTTDMDPSLESRSEAITHVAGPQK